jgi:hypothetical protein
MKPVLALGTEHVMLAVILFLAAAEPTPPDIDAWASQIVEIEVFHHGAEPDGYVDGLVAKQKAPLQVGHVVDQPVEQHSDVKASSPDVPDAGHAEISSVHPRS